LSDDDGDKREDTSHQGGRGRKKKKNKVESVNLDLPDSGHFNLFQKELEASEVSYASYTFFFQILINTIRRERSPVKMETQSI
jgi:hypothetical protein